MITKIALNRPRQIDYKVHRDGLVRMRGNGIQNEVTVFVKVQGFCFMADVAGFAVFLYVHLHPLPIEFLT